MFGYYGYSCCSFNVSRWIICIRLKSRKFFTTIRWNLHTPNEPGLRPLVENICQMLAFNSSCSSSSLQLFQRWKKLIFRSLTLDQQVSSVVSAFKQKLGMVNWSTLAATLGVCYCAVRPLCHLLRLITEMAPTSFCFLLWTLGSISWISLWTIACVTDSAIHQKIGSS